jgi:hypothetical protein
MLTAILRASSRVKVAQAINILAEIDKAIERCCSYIPVVLGALAQAEL